MAMIAFSMISWLYTSPRMIALSPFTSTLNFSVPRLCETSSFFSASALGASSLPPMPIALPAGFMKSKMPISCLLAYDQNVAGRICLIGPGDVRIKALLLHDG